MDYHRITLERRRDRKRFYRKYCRRRIARDAVIIN